MSVTITVSDEVARYIDELAYEGAADVDEKLRNLLIAEYQRRLGRYKRVDNQLVQKYGMSFEAFEQQKMTEQKNFTWEVESDAMNWETAIDGVDSMQAKLNELTR